MEVRILGTVQVISNGQPILRARRQERLLLGLLALEADRVITIPRLEQLLWDEASPRNPRQAIQVYVSRLRSQLDAAGIVLASRGGGYTLRVEPDRVDALRFTTRLAEARTVTEPDRRALRLREALALWRGPLLADAAGDALRHRIGQGLAEQRLTAIELRVEAELEAGGHAELVPELADLTAEHPARERLLAARMTALHRSGRSPEALAVYRRSAAELGQRTGLDVGRPLKDLYVSILRADPRPDRGDRPPAADAPAQLPADLNVFVGRAPELARLTAPRPTARRGRSAVFAIDGMPGVGKTALAVHAAHRIGDRFPDGQLHVNLHGFTRDAPPAAPAEVLDRLLRALGTPPQRIPHHTDDRSAAFRSLVARRRLLIILDNAVDEEQVEPLLPASTGSRVFITSRTRLSGLDDVTFVSVPPLTSAESVDLFERVAGTGRVTGGADLAEGVATVCGRLPLAVRIAAARMRDDTALTVDSLLERLKNSDAPLNELASGHRAVAAALDLSYRHLDGDARLTLRMLGLAPAMPVDAATAAALAGQAPDAAATALRALTTARLLDSTGPDRYDLHDLTRHYAIDRAETEDTAEDRRAALGRLLEYLLSMAALAAHRIEPSRFALKDDVDPAAIPDHQAALSWLDDAMPQLAAAIHRGHAEGFHRQVWVLCARIAEYFSLRGRYDDWLSTHETGLASAVATDDDLGRAYMLIRLAYPYKIAGDLPRALDCCAEAAELFGKLNEPISQGAALSNLGWMAAEAAADPRAFDTARGHLERALALMTRVGDTSGQGRALDSLGDVHRLQRRYDDALRYYERSLSLARESGQLDDEGAPLYGSALVHIARGQPRRAIALLTESLSVSRRAGAVSRIPQSLEQLGNAHRELGEPDEAARYHRELAELIPELDTGLVTGDMHASIAETLAAVGDAEAAAAHRRSAEELGAN